MTMKKLFYILISLVCAQVSAGTQTWNFSNSSVTGSGYNNSINMVVDGISMTVTGWSDTLGRSDRNDPLSETIERAKLVHWQGYGLGVENRDGDSGTPNHSIDSYDGSWGDDIDMVLLSFSKAVSLKGLSIGWAYEDYYGNYQAQADITTVAYTGNNAPNFDGRTWGQVAADSAWTFVDNLIDASANQYHTVDNKGNILSNYWLVGAYNPVFSNTNYSSDNDGFKLTGLTTEFNTTTTPPPTDVPEPSMFVLMLILLGLMYRSKQQQQ